MNLYKLVSISIIILLFLPLLGMESIEAQRITLDQLYNMAVDQLYDMFRVLYMSWKNYELIEDYEIEYLVAWCESLVATQQAPSVSPQLEIGYSYAYYIGGYRGVNLAVVIRLVSCVKSVLSNPGLLAQLRYLIRIGGISKDTLSIYVTKIVRNFPNIETKLYDAVKSIVDSVKDTDTRSNVESWAKFGIVESLRRAISKVINHLGSSVRYWADKLLSGGMFISIPTVVFLCVPKWIFRGNCFPLVDRGNACCIPLGGKEEVVM